MKTKLVLLLAMLFDAIIRGADERKLRYYVRNPRDNFFRDMCDFVATILVIRANFKVGTIRDEEGNVYTIKMYTLPDRFTSFINMGEVYFTEAVKEKATPIFKASWIPKDFLSAVKEFQSARRSEIVYHKKTVVRKDENGKDVFEEKADDVYDEVHIMSPDRMNAFFKDLGVDVAKCQASGDFHPLTLQDFDMVSDDKGEGMYLIGEGKESNEWAWLSGVTVDEGIGTFLRYMPKPTDEELISWMKGVFF
jgi:hypothetical protein